MPFLGRRFSNVGAPQLALDGTAAQGISQLWEEDVYRPSGLLGIGYSVGEGTNAVHASERRHCGNLECARTRVIPWRSRRRPVFEGQWACTGRCVLAMVRAAVRREYGEALASSGEASHRHRVPLGLVLLAQGWITHPQLQHALEVQRLKGGRIGEWLIAECGVEPEKVTRGLSVQWNCPVLTTGGFRAREMTLVMPKVFVQEFEALPLRTAGSRILYVGFEQRLNASLALALEQMTELKVESGLVSGEDLLSAKNALLAAKEIPLKQESVSDIDVLVSRIAAVVEQRQPVNGKLVRLHQHYWLRLWLESGTMGGQGCLPLSEEDMADYVFSVGLRA